MTIASSTVRSSTAARPLTMFLDMGAFDDVWSRRQPVDQGVESER